MVPPSFIVPPVLIFIEHKNLKEKENVLFQENIELNWGVVYFDQLSGAVRTRKLVETFFFSHFKHIYANLAILATR